MARRGSKNEEWSFNEKGTARHEYQGSNSYHEEITLFSGTENIFYFFDKFLDTEDGKYVPVQIQAKKGKIVISILPKEK